MTPEEEQLAGEIDLHMLALLRSDGKQATAIEWMKRAYNLLERASKQIRSPKVYAIPGSFGVPTYVLTPPKQLVLPPPGFKSPPPIWFSGKTVEYGDRYQNTHIATPTIPQKAWTAKDSERLERQRKQQRLEQQREQQRVAHTAKLERRRTSRLDPSVHDSKEK